jgi:hypothetical protein
MELLRALRHADTSVVIDLSHTSHRETVEYVRTILQCGRTGCAGLLAKDTHAGAPRIAIPRDQEMVAQQ